ncbi:sigma-70 family RNA polymerase sigma factor [Pedobacter sp.]|uniref:sigma-70 family RNA polymerase sigma factor n=1 Tax=Pedobacter sp. TaxID=1411316 RepID=UPI003D7F80D3
MELNHYSDSELLEAMKLDVNKAFDTFYHRYWSGLYNTVFHHLKDGEVSSEIVHDIFLLIWQKRHDYHIQSIRSYLNTIAMHSVYKHLKAKRATNILYIANYEQLNHHSKSVNEGEEKLSCKELELTLDYSLQHLPKRCREIFILSRKTLMTNEAIARRLGISKRTVENQLTCALHFLRPLFK